MPMLPDTCILTLCHVHAKMGKNLALTYYFPLHDNDNSNTTLWHWQGAHLTNWRIGVLLGE